MTIQEEIRISSEDLDALLRKECARDCILQENVYQRVNPLTEDPGVMRGIVEIPRGSRNKYEIDKATGMVRLDRRLAGSLYYPVDYGIFPQTLCGDGDPLDLLLIVNEPTFSGCMVEARILGLFKMWEKEDEDYKILAVPAKDPSFRSWTSLEQVTRELREEIEHFFNRYKELEGAPIRTLGFSDATDALAVVHEMHRRYNEGRKRLAKG